MVELPLRIVIFPPTGLPLKSRFDWVARCLCVFTELNDLGCILFIQIEGEIPRVVWRIERRIECVGVKKSPKLENPTGVHYSNCGDNQKRL